MAVCILVNPECGRIRCGQQAVIQCTVSRGQLILVICFVSILCTGHDLAVRGIVDGHNIPGIERIQTRRAGGLLRCAGLDSVLQLLYLAPRAVQNGSGFQRAILLDGNSIAIKIRICGSILIAFVRGVAAIQRIVDGGAIGRAGQLDRGACLHLTRLGLGQRRGDGDFLGAALTFRQFVNQKVKHVLGSIGRGIRAEFSLLGAVGDRAGGVSRSRKAERSIAVCNHVPGIGIS